MFELWIILAIFVAFLEGFANIIKKIVLKGKFRSYSYIMPIGFINLLYAVITFLIIRTLTGPPLYILISLLSGIIGTLASITFLHSIKHEEISRVVPIRSIAPLIIALLAAIFIGEIFTPLIYFSIFLIFIGTFFLSFRFRNGMPKKINGLGTLFLSLVFFSIQMVMIKFVLFDLDFKVYILYHFIGYFIGTIPLWS